MSRLEAARDIADSVLYPAAETVDRTGVLPREQLDLIADAGLYGITAPAEFGGAADRLEVDRVVELLASGCLTTAFVWIQHLGAVRAAASADPLLRDRWLRPLCTGERRAAVAQAGVRPGPTALRAIRVDGGYRFEGEAPWVTGWGFVDVVHTAARTDDDQVVWALVDAVTDSTLSVEPLDLVAVNASRTVSIRFAGTHVADDRVTATMSMAEWAERDAAGLRTNGSLSLGAVDRCLRLLRSTGVGEPIAGHLAEALTTCRDELDGAGPESLPGARAAAAELAFRAAGTLAVAAGARGVLPGQPSQRLLREAMFLLVFGSRPAIRAELLRRVVRVDR